MEAGERGKLKCILQEDFGHSVAVDLINGAFAIDFEGWSFDQEITLVNPKTFLFICDDTNIGADVFHVERKLVKAKNEHGKYIREENGLYRKVRQDVVRPLEWRPIWFTRITSGVPTKVIGAQTTMPEELGGKNVKKMVMLYADGRIGIA